MPRLAKLLGYTLDQPLLIVNCDDIGSSHSANVASEAAIRDGLATSATLMVPCPWAREAAEQFKDLDVGIHLTLTAEYPTYRWRSLTGARSLRDAQGYLPRTARELWAQADPVEVEAECRAQIDQALAWSVDITHLDNHMGTLQMSRDLFPIYVKLAKEYQLPLRMAGEGADARLGFNGRHQAREAGVLYPDHFSFQWGTLTAELFEHYLANPRPGVLEMILHPVSDGPELRAYDKEAVHIRTHDAACGIDQTLKARIDNAGIKRISFRPLREAIRVQQDYLHWR
ncbi:MAG: polysaccharide deacetylase family protein [Alphaproteobacteria bacterium]|nr:polysaccharide deacetylase family protein [Alphaproteobacteria bacterium]MBV9418160.1 polysaccharide deacetylase family protein [Alphaproteobacteria bacterium]MBV9542155.1 polysaccharide deacetylase family protein [Alphaproteobacteria bacterium]